MKHTRKIGIRPFFPETAYNNDIQGGPKNGYPVLFFWDNFGNSAPILTILSLLQAKIYGA